MGRQGKNWVALSPRLGMGRVLTQKERRSVLPSPLAYQHRRIALSLLAFLFVLTGLIFMFF